VHLLGSGYRGLVKDTQGSVCGQRLAFIGLHRSDKFGIGALTHTKVQPADSLPVDANLWSRAVMKRALFPGAIAERRGLRVRGGRGSDDGGENLLERRRCLGPGARCAVNSRAPDYPGWKCQTIGLNASKIMDESDQQ
jgi:hypothetical protein